MAITYKGMEHGVEDPAKSVALDDTNIEPLFKLWLLLTTNPGFLGGTVAVDRAKIAGLLNVTPSVVDYVFDDFGKNHFAKAQAAANLFQSLAYGPYGNTICPTSTTPIVPGGDV